MPKATDKMFKLGEYITLNDNNKKKLIELSNL